MILIDTNSGNDLIRVMMKLDPRNNDTETLTR